MKRVLYSGLFTLMLLLGLPSLASAATLSLSLSNSGSAGLVQARITGAPTATITLHYSTSSGSYRTLKLGKTDSAGTLSQTVDPSSYSNLGSGTLVYATSDTGLQSSTRTWPDLPGTVTGSDFTLALDTVTAKAGETVVVPAYELGTGALVVSSNSRSSVAQVSVNGSQVFVTGVVSGSTTAIICLASSTQHCQTIAVTVGSVSTSALSFSQTNPVLVVGTSTTVVISGNSSGQFYLSNNSNPSVVQANIAYNAITLIGNRAGTATISVCKSSSVCSSFTATVVDKGASHAPILVPGSVSLMVGQGVSVSIAGAGGYSLEGHSSASVADVTVQSTSVYVKALAVGSRTVSVCDSNDDCTDLDISVTALVIPKPTPTPTTTPTTPTTGTTAPYQFTTFLQRGTQSTEVLALQLLLKGLGYLTATPNGYFGPATEAAVKKFQAAHGIAQAGYVGPATRTALNGK